MEITPISPITNLRVLKGVPLDSSYTDTMTFSSKSAQTTYFTSKAKFSWSNLTPVRVNNVIRIPANQDSLFDCNYIMFQNTNFGNKWIYAFIKNFTYINPNMTEVSIEIDAFQTWAFDYTLKDSLVIREHSQYDEYGENVLIEPIELGEYVEEQHTSTGALDSYSAVVSFAPDADTIAIKGTVGGTFSGLATVWAEIDGSSEQTILDMLTAKVSSGKSDSIVSTYVFPTQFLPATDVPPSQVARGVISYDANILKQITTLGSYIPRNKKLLSYPYNMLTVSNSMGVVKNFRYEYFSTTNYCNFVMACSINPSPQVILYPTNYNGQDENIDELMSITGFPQFAFVIDTYRAWLAMNGNQMFLSQLSAMVSASASAYTGNVVGAVQGSIGLANLIESVNVQQQRGNTSQGSQSSDTLAAMRKKDFIFYNRHVREDYAKILDDYFDMYGYLTNRVKVPNITGRPYWNYVKTEDAKVIGSIPFDDIVTIKQALNRGITFWHDSDVGNYNRLNSPQEK